MWDNFVTCIGCARKIVLDGTEKTAIISKNYRPSGKAAL
jgi:hypothetical protein